MVSETPEEAFVESIKTTHSDAIISAEVLRPKRASIIVKMDNFLEIAKSLKDEFGFTHPISAGAVDFPKENRMRMIYYMMNPESRFMLTFGMDVSRDNPKLPSMTSVWEAMSFHEREAHEMFGISFEGHSNLAPLLLPPDWKGGYPLRKDFKGEEVEG